jgi:hypothetical protein
MKVLFVLIFVLCPQSPLMAQGAISLGSGFSTVTGGRRVPSLFVGLRHQTGALYFQSVGFRNDLFYHSAYQLLGLKVQDLGQTLWGQTLGGVGLGLQYSKRAYRETTDGEIQVVSDFNIGPAFRLSWMAIPYFNAFVSTEAVFGIGNLNFLILSFQYTASLSVGIEF